MPLKNSCSIHAVWSIPYVSEAFFPSLKLNFIASRSSSRPDCIFEIHQLWQLGFSSVYCNCCSSRWFEPEIINLGQSSHKMYSNNILNFQGSTTILKASTYGMHDVSFFIRISMYLRICLFKRLLRSIACNGVSTELESFHIKRL